MLTIISLLVALVVEGLIIWKSKCHQNPLVLSDGYGKYEETEVYRLAIMQDFRDIEKKKLNGRQWPTSGHFGFYNCEICHGLSLCETLHFVL